MATILPKILIEDERLIAVQKHAGQLVVADRFGIERNILLHEVGGYLRSKGHKPDASGRDLYPVHRLDRDTSGVVLFAKDEEAHRALSRMFEQREMEKTYWAMVAGQPEWDWARSCVPLSRAEGKKGRGRALVDLSRGKPAETEFKVKERYGDIALVECFPRTGRLHQIRLHLRSLGHPLLFDDAYGFDSWSSKYFSDMPRIRMPLHARELRFTHPFTGDPVSVVSPLEEDFRKLMNYCKNAWEALQDA